MLPGQFWIERIAAQHVRQRDQGVRLQEAMENGLRGGVRFDGVRPESGPIKLLVLRRNPALRFADARQFNSVGAALGFQFRQEYRHGAVQIACGQVAQAPQPFGHFRAGAGRLPQAAQPALHLLECAAGVQQMTMFFRRQDLIEQLPIERRRIFGLRFGAVMYWLHRRSQVNASSRLLAPNGEGLSSRCVTTSTRCSRMSVSNCCNRGM